MSENETFSVCAELSAGSVGCDVSIALDAQLGSAIGKPNRYINRFNKGDWMTSRV